MICYLLFSYNKTVYYIFHRPLCTFSLLEEKNCTKRETGKGARKPFVPSDEPEQSSDNHYGEAVRKGSGTSPLLRCPQTGSSRAVLRDDRLFADFGAPMVLSPP